MSPLLYDAAPMLLLAALTGLAVSTLAFALERVQLVADLAARDAVREALDAVPRVGDPMVAAITGEIEVQRVCPHLSILDRLDGLTCSECNG